MERYQCAICGFIYDEEKGDLVSHINPGTKWEDIPDDYVCPICGAAKDSFIKND